MTLRVKNWERFQHFKDRKPIWVKLYRDLLDDLDFHELDGDSAKTLVMLWLIASENAGILPEEKEIAFRLRTTTKSIKSTISKLSHWLYQDDINLISDINSISNGYQDDALEKRREEKEKEKKGGAFNAEGIELPSYIERVVWLKWIEYRRGRKLPCSKVTIEAQLSNLAKWEASGHSPEEIIMSSIANGWQGLFEPKQNGGNNGKQTRFDKLEQCADELTGRNRIDTRTFDGYATQVD